MAKWKSGKLGFRKLGCKVVCLSCSFFTVCARCRFKKTRGLLTGASGFRGFGLVFCMFIKEEASECLVGFPDLYYLHPPDS